MNNNKLNATTKSVEKVLPKIKKIDRLINSLSTTELIPPLFRKYKSNNFKKTRFGYATIVFLSEDYIPAALALGYSLKKYKNKYNKICLVQDVPVYKYINGEKKYFPGVSKKTISDLLKMFDIVYGINLLQINLSDKNNRHFTVRYKHYKNISIYPTKSQVLGLIEYEQIIFLDASTVVNKNIDYMFKLYKGNSYLWESYLKKMNMGLHGAFFIFKPSKFFYTKAMYLTKYYQKIFGSLYFERGIDETVLYFSIYPNWSKKLIAKWTRCTDTYRHKNCPIYHYQLHKPFKKSVNEINVESSFVIWDSIVKDFLNNYPKFIKYYKDIKKFRNVNYIN